MSHYTVAETSAETQADSICALWTQNLKSGRAEHARNKLQQGYVANPAASGALFAVHEQADPTLVGVIGLHPRRFFLEEREWLAATLSDFAVDSAHRSAGPALMLMRAAINAGRERFGLVFGIPNRHSYAICRRAGMSSLGTLTRYTLVSSSRQRLAQRLVPWLLPVASPLVDLALRCRLLWKSLRVRPALSCRETSFDDASLDTVWAQRPRSLLLSDRSASMLRWRYCWNASKPWRISMVRDTDGVDCGYIIWRLEDELAVIGDFFSIDPPRLTPSLLLAFAKTVLAQGAHSVSASFLGAESVSSAFSSAGFFLAETSGDRVLVASDMRFGELPLSCCYLTAFDNDD